MVWFIYPIILAIGTDGLKYIGPTATTAGIAILDLVAKVAFGLLAVTSRAKIVDRDLNEVRTVGSSRATGLAPAE